METSTFKNIHNSRSIRALSALVDAFEIPYGLLASTIAENKFAALVADPEITVLRFYGDRTAHPTRVFRSGGRG